MSRTMVTVFGVPALAFAALLLATNSTLAGGGGGRGGGGGGGRGGSGFRGQGRGELRGGGGRGWGGGWYEPWYYGYGYDPYGGYPSGDTSFYQGPIYPDQQQTYDNAGPQVPTQATDENTAMIGVRVPQNAEIWFDGQKTSRTGTVRQFETPPLQPGQEYGYDVRARWNENGRQIDRTRHVTVHAGDRFGLNFLEGRKNAPRAPSQESK
jgi:uncharacterized protein (TIGR03000 family)